MSQRRHTAELGSLVDIHRPAKIWIGWLIAIGFALPFGLLVGLGPPGPLVGLVIFLLIAFPLLYGFAEWCFLEHRLYEHGIVLRSIPGLRVYVIPHHAIDPDSVDIGGRRVHDGSFRGAISSGFERVFRVTPFAAATVRFVGLHPKRAHRLAKSKLDWTTASAPGDANFTPVSNWWWLSYRDPQRHRQLIEETVRRSQQTRRYQSHGR